MSLLTVKKPKSRSQHYPLWMWKYIGTRHWSCPSVPTDYVNWYASGLKPQTTAITSHSSQYRMSGLLWSMSWRFYGHSSTGPCGCRNDILSLCIMSSLSTMICLITWMAWCELWPTRRHNGWKTYSVLWSLHGKSCPNIIVKWLQWLVCSSFRHTFLILSGSCDRLWSGTTEWISILKTRLLLLPNSRRSFWSMWRMNTALNTDVFRLLNPKTYWTTIPASPQWLIDLVNLLMNHMICPVIMKNT